MKDKKIDNKKELQDAFKGCFGFLLYFIMSFGSTVPLDLFNIDYTTMDIVSKQVYLIGYSFLTVFLFFILYEKDIIRDFKDFKVNYKTYFCKYFKYWLFAIAIMYCSNVCIVIIKYLNFGAISIANNEETVRETLAKAPYYTFIAAAITAPFIEEMTFRKSIRKVFNNDLVFIIISAFIFGGLHVFTTNMTLIDLLYLVPYCAPGVAFAYIYVKTNNIFSSMSLHFLHNSILMILQVILLTRGLL